MKKFMKLFTMMIIALMAVPVFTSCGNSDDDDVPEGYVEVTEGKHRIEVTFSGDVTGCEGTMAYVAVNGISGDVNLYENGQLMSSNGGFYSEVLRDCDIETSTASLFMTTIGITRKNFQEGKDITITLKGYINGKQTNMMVVDMPATTYTRSIVFYSEDIGGDYVK